MKIEVLYPEIANLFGDLANIRYVRASVPDCEVHETDLKSRPLFLDAENGIDLVYMGTMTENSQLIAMDHAEKYLEDIRRAIVRGQRFLFTGNAFEIFAKDIIDLDDMPYSAGHPRVDEAQRVTRCLGIFDITVKREMMHRFNSLYLGKYGDIEVTGFKSVFTHAVCNTEYSPMFETIKGPGLDKTASGEGIRYNNFMATYLTGPLFLLNPAFMIRFLEDMGEKDIRPPYLQAGMEAYEQRLSEFKREGINYIY